MNNKIMHFESTYIKLTLIYVLIVMIFSITFSVIIYRISSKELGRGLGRQSIIFRNLPINIQIHPSPDFEQIRLDQLAQSNSHLRINLIYLNLLILLLSTGFSYVLAKKTLEPIAEAMDAQNRFTADASHELRTPLTAMRTELEVNLRNNNLNLVHARQLLASNLEEVQKLEILSNALLKLARNEENRHIFEQVSLEEVLIDAYEKIESLAEKKSIEINCNPELDSGSSHIVLYGDKNSLVELFIILLDNAIKYSPENSKIFIDVISDNKHTFVKIKDQGIGIKAGDLPYIFNRFYRADSSRSKEEVNGYGLGLSIAKSIIDTHNGKISVKSTPGKGSEFTIQFAQTSSVSRSNQTIEK